MRTDASRFSASLEVTSEVQDHSCHFERSREIDFDNLTLRLTVHIIGQKVLIQRDPVSPDRVRVRRGTG
jgi:hypothetical protein